MFVQNKYYRWYTALTASDDGESARTERHHRIPKSLGGGNDPSNLVRLSLRRHFLAHWLLTKCTEGIAQKKMLKALGCMRGNRLDCISPWQYQIAMEAARAGRRGIPSPMKGKKFDLSPETRMRLSKARRGVVLSEEHKRKIGESGRGRSVSLQTREKIASAHIGKKHSEETRRKIRDAKTGIAYSDETKLKISVSLIGNKRSVGRIHSQEVKDRMSAAHRSKSIAQSNSRLGLRGVSRHVDGRFRARTKFKGKRVEIGLFDCPAAAHLAYLVTSNALHRASLEG